MISPRPLARRSAFSSDLYWLLGLVALHVLVLWFRVGPILLHPSEYLFTTGGDGIKSYFALLYYLQADAGVQFTGMHYPYGELLTFTDGFPLLAWALKAWKNAFGITLSQAVAAFNLTVLLSSVPTTPLVFALLRRGGVGRWFGAAATLAIVFLAPQFHRIGAGHYTLALPFVVPLLWYLQLRLLEAATRAARLQWLVLYVVTTLLVTLVHPYYLLHALLLPAATALVLAAQRLAARQGQWWAQPAWLLAAGLLPPVLFQTWIGLLDPITDRPINPYGFFVYHTNVAGVFGPSIEPFAAVFKFIFHTSDPIMEGKAYVGLVVGLGVGLWLLRVGWHLVHRRWRGVLRPALPAMLQPTVWAAWLVLAFSMCLPFILPGFDRLLDWLPALKQFRSLGRFAWIFYYVAAVLAAVQYWQLYRFLRQRRAARLGQLLLVAVAGVWLLEAKYQLKELTAPLLPNRVADTFLQPGGNYAETLARAGHYPDQYQAILPLPYYSLGSEKFDLGGGGVGTAESFRAALSLQRPIAATMMSRTSTEQTLRLLELFSSDLTPKSWPGRLPSRQPLLVVASRLDSLRPAEKALLQRGAVLLTTTPLVKLYELPLRAFATSRPAAERAWFAAHQNELLRQGQLWRTVAGPGVVWRTFQDATAPGSVSFTRPGAAHADKGMLPVFDGVLPGAADTTSYELSIWAYAKTTDWMPYLSYRQLSPTGQEVERVERSLKESTEIHGDWVRFTLPIRLQNRANRIVVEMGGDDIVVDDLLIRPRTTHVYWLDARQQPVLDGFPLAR
ncbi:hypothetical protein K3G63_19075 [Hymenobacter sp. HSC-4F20]|uniref:hypothetical protein n=1 Tax=Hymenobacter sp. HSC-4F20 TaxID=2864135 RepID=UPI001C730607|nr:hypothetical protein [Hymenobacter sp. HSC-4F20]MBX0292554.1 hypothetical protein [Hymenobacter sp. HSC-4F20]